MRALRPSVDTKFHIDFSWWAKQNKDIRVFMRELLCPESLEAAAAAPDKQLVDMVDPETAEVTRADALWEAIRACCSLKPGRIERGWLPLAKKTRKMPSRMGVSGAI